MTREIRPNSTAFRRIKLTTRNRSNDNDQNRLGYLTRTTAADKQQDAVDSVCNDTNVNDIQNTDELDRFQGIAHPLYHRVDHNRTPVSRPAHVFKIRRPHFYLIGILYRNALEKARTGQRNS